MCISAFPCSSVSETSFLTTTLLCPLWSLKYCKIIQQKIWFQFIKGNTNNINIRDTKRGGTRHWILGRSTWWPQIYCVCMGISRQIIFLKVSSEQFMDSKVKELGKRLYLWNMKDLVVLKSVQVLSQFFIHFSIFLSAKIQANVWEIKSAVTHILAQPHLSDLV